MTRVALCGVEDPSHEVQELYHAVRQVSDSVSRDADRQLRKVDNKLPQMWRALAHSPPIGHWIVRDSKAFFTETSWTTDNPRLRQIVVLTLAKRLNSEVVFRWHAELAESLGVPQEKIAILLDSVERAKTSSAFEQAERLLISFADEIVTTWQVRDEIFRDVLQRYGTKSAIEISAFLAFYVSVISLCNVLGVEED